MKVELIFLAGETPIAFISFRKTNIETLIHVNVNHATFVPVKKYSWLNKYSIKLDSGRNDFIQISAFKLGFNSNVMKRKNDLCTKNDCLIKIGRSILLGAVSTDTFITITDSKVINW